MIQINDLLIAKNSLTLRNKDRIQTIEKESIIKVINKTDINKEKMFNIEFLCNKDIFSLHVWTGDKNYLSIYNTMTSLPNTQMVHIDFIKTNFFKINV